MAEQRDIKYINREFSDLKNSLIEYAKNYFPDTYNDFSEASPGQMFIEMAAYVGDVLSYYQDTQLQETFLQHAKNPANLYSLAYMMGYRPKATAASSVDLTITQRIPAKSSGSGFVPDFSYAVKLSDNSTANSSVSGDVSFLLTRPVDFTFSSSYDPTEVTIYSLDSGNPSEFLLSKTVRANSATINSTTFTFGSAQKFSTVTLDDTNIIKVLDITDSDGNIWYEVPYLAQDTIVKSEVNTESDNNLVPYSIKLENVARRFVTRLTSTGKLEVQFGAGVVIARDEEFTPDPTFVVKYGDADTVDKLDLAFDPSNFLFTRTYGQAPSNTTLTVRYLTGGGVTANVPAGTINELTTTPTPNDGVYSATLAVTNNKPAAGGKDGDTVDEIRQNSLKAFAEQKRAVTVEDITVRALSLPPDFGSVAKAYVTKEALSESVGLSERNPLALSLYILSYDANGKLITSSQSLKNNLKQYLSQYLMLTDAIDIKDAFIVNIGVKYEILTLPNYQARDVLINVTNTLKDYFKIQKWSINQSINLSKIYTLIDNVKGVQTVKNIRIVNKTQGVYSEYAYDTEGATKDNIVYPSYDPCIFEIKYPDEDIEGRVTTL